MVSSAPSALTRRRFALGLCGVGASVALPGIGGAATWYREATARLPRPRARPKTFRRGASLGLFVSKDYRGSKRGLYEAFLGEMLDAGVTDVQLIVRWAQNTIHDVNLRPDPAKEEDDETVGWVMDTARRFGLRPFLMPTIHVRRETKGSWRGAIQPADWGAWWSSYRTFIFHYAELAQRHGADLFAIGSELVSTQGQEAQWRSLIEAVRRRFDGKLTYSANWDRFEGVKIWDALDLAGLNAYVPLSRILNPSETDLVQGWHAFKTQVEAWAKRHQHDFIFTEIGYPSNPYAAIRPYDYRELGHPDEALQLRCYRALYRAWQDVDGMAGLYFWNWFGRGGPMDKGYTPRGKAAYEVIRHWYKGSMSPNGNWRGSR